MVVDAKKFYRVSAEKLVELKGKPQSKDNWNFDSSNGKTYKATTYGYDNGNIEFLLIDGKVVRFTHYPQEQKFTSDNDLFKMYGITPSGEMKKSGNGLTFKYNSLADGTPELWLTLAEDQIDTVKITYDLRYF